MEKVESSKGVSNWETLHRYILVIIFNKLNVMDITMGASRVCTSWFLASHDKTLWNTVDLAKIQQKGRPILFYKHQVDNEVEEEFPLTKTTTWYLYDTHGVEEGMSLLKLLIKITNLNGTVTKNLFFNFHSYIKEKELKFAAERLKNIEKLALPIWFDSTEESCRFSFSQWKNLKTLIIVHDSYLTKTIFEFRIVGENCRNLTNLKYLGTFQVYYSKEIVCYLQSIKRLSLRCSSVSIEAVLWLMKRLENLTILNLSHCKELYMSSGMDMNPRTIHDYNDYLVQAATQKLEKLIICPQYNCKVCKDGPNGFEPHLSFQKHWRNDEIKELEF
ncbi:putative F-box protein [Cardamine amara subsp. amara]|uniref:F-box protein n=1 Tax=Cardamine amara subsp. amara TaxID=228776 RepID=A0ABD1B7A7_CARAN